jgi:hypothetical protein
MSIEGMFAWKVPVAGGIAGFGGYAHAGSLHSSGVKHYLPTLERSKKETKTRSSCS